MALCCSIPKSCPTLCNPIFCSMPGLTVLQYLLEFVQTHVHWIDDAIKPFHPLLSPFPKVLNFSQHQGLFQWVSSLHKWPKCWSFSIRLSNEYSGLFSFRISWFDLLAFQGTFFFFLLFNTTLFQPEHLNIKLNTGELFSLLILNYCKCTSSASSSTLK